MRTSRPYARRVIHSITTICRRFYARRADLAEYSDAISATRKGRRFITKKRGLPALATSVRLKCREQAFLGDRLGDKIVEPCRQYAFTLFFERMRRIGDIAQVIEAGGNAVLRYSPTSTVRSISSLAVSTRRESCFS
jgi:hypothetical protein